MNGPVREPTLMTRQAGLGLKLSAVLDGVGLSDTLAFHALTHRSYANEHRIEALPDNERLELLGDAVLQLIVTEYLMNALPAAQEGTLSLERAALVSTETLAVFAKQRGLDALLLLGKGERATGGANKESVLADALEAAIGAMYLEQGLSGVRQIPNLLSAVAVRPVSQNEPSAKDAKTLLQELTQSIDQSLPNYRVEPVYDGFTASVLIHGTVAGVGRGPSKKEAERAAANDALLALRSKSKKR